MGLCGTDSLYETPKTIKIMLIQVALVLKLWYKGLSYVFLANLLINNKTEIKTVVDAMQTSMNSGFRPFNANARMNRKANKNRAPIVFLNAKL